MGQDLSDPRPSLCICHQSPDAAKRCPIHREIVNVGVQDVERAYGGYTRDPESGMMVLDPTQQELDDVEAHEYDIRTWALDAASRVFAGRGGSYDQRDRVIHLAKEFEEYLRGEH